MKAVMYFRVNSEEQLKEGDPMKIAIYIRTATPDEESRARQEKACRALAAKKGWPVAAVYVDEGINGLAPELPAFTRLLAAAREHSFDVVVMQWRNRLGRDMRLVSRRLAMLQRLGLGALAVDLDETAS